MDARLKPWQPWVQERSQHRATGYNHGKARVDDAPNVCACRSPGEIRIWTEIRVGKINDTEDRNDDVTGYIISNLLSAQPLGTLCGLVPLA